MKYSKRFILEFTKDLNITDFCDLETKLSDFEKDFYNRNIYEVPIDKITTEVCRETLVTEEEFYSNLRCGNLPKARRILLVALTRVGLKAKAIAELTNFTQSRIINSVRKADDEEKLIADKILNSL